MIGMLRSAQGKRWRAQTPHGETALRTAAKLLTISVAVLHIDTAKQMAKDQEDGFIPPGPLPDL
ncbi:hypothetical protein HOY34_20630 [Xinfangfangia sp. D13-10-4-6]|uniref:hypothetical protein n=1 Tax=Pseudogemmobacter hezensis TaxID=2737662 RepID=UPI001554D154|nr:hypothetical protein [Pseudogemmobacter hezensis]NPD17595.1 hypothetical protein [Pseudogemmobacter hezensis]